MVNDSAAILVELGLTLLQIIDVVRETAFTYILFFGCTVRGVCSGVVAQGVSCYS